MPGSSPAVHVDADRGVATLTLDNPARKNAITLEMAETMRAFCERVQHDESIGAVVVQAAGDYFCSGADTRDLASFSENPAHPESVRRTSAVYEAFASVGRLPVPSLSVVTGGAVGAGVNLALATDVLLITPDAVLDSGFLARGIHPGGGHLSLIGRAAGRQAAFALAVFGTAISGTEAVARGIAWACPAREELPAAVRALTAGPAADPELARRIKQSAELELGPPAATWPAALEVERGMQMWSLARKGSAAWARKPGQAGPATGSR